MKSLIESLSRWIGAILSEWNITWPKSSWTTQPSKPIILDSSDTTHSDLEELLAKKTNDIEDLQRRLQWVKSQADAEKVKVLEILKRAAQINWRLDRGPNEQYALTVYIDAHMIKNVFNDRHHREYLAKDVGRQIEHQILTAQFIEDARANERMEWERNRSNGPRLHPFSD